MVVVVHFDAEGRIRSENTYFGTPDLMDRFPLETYESLPGASRL